MFSKMLPGYKYFHCRGFGLGDLRVYSIFLFSCRNLFSYSTRISENCVMKIGDLFLQVISVSG